MPPEPPPAPPPAPGDRPTREARPPWRVLGGFWEKAGAWALPADARGEGYWTLARREPALLGFSLLFVFTSSFGQTFLLSIFQPHWMRTLGLSPAAMGSLYGGATLASGLLLPFAGRWLDRAPVGRAAVVTLLGLGLFGALAASVSTPWLLAVALFGLRFFGQGLSSNLGITTAARWFEHNRGKALSLAGLGYPLGEALLPGLVTVLIALLGWRFSWLALAGVVLLVLWPLSHRLLRPAPAEVAEPAAVARAGAPARRSFARDSRFSLMMALIAPLPFVGTGIIFFQGMLAEARGWSPALFPTGFLLFAIVRAFVSLSAGAWVDRLGAVRLLAVPPLVFAAALACLLRPEEGWAYGFFLGFGVAFGTAGSINNAAWAELFGRDQLGAIRGLSSAVAVFLTAAAPVLYGLALNLELPVEAVILGSAGLMLGLGWPMSLLVRQHVRRPHPDGG